MLGLRFPMRALAGGRGGAALSLDFVGPGASLDSRLAFTRASTATRFNEAGLLETVGSSMARLDYDPITRTPKGLLIEDQRTNIFLNSRADSALPNWALGSNTTRVGTTVVPDGTTAAVYRNSSNAFAFVSQAYTLATNTTYTVSCYARRVSGTGAGGSIISAAYHDGATQQRANVPMAAVPSDGSVARVAVTFTNVTAGSYTSFFFADTGAAVGDVAIWNVQCEAGAFASSYIPTASAPVTRAADIATIATSAFPFNLAAGVFVLRTTPAAVSSALPALTVDDGTANERYRIVNETGIWKVQVGDNGAIQADISVGPAVAGAVAGLALAYAPNDVAGVLNGGAIGLDASATLPTVTALTLGSGWHRALGYYPRRLSNAELQQVTA